jgi:hypothetical protein
MLQPWRPQHNNAAVIGRDVLHAVPVYAVGNVYTKSPVRGVRRGIGPEQDICKCGGGWDATLCWMPCCPFVFEGRSSVLTGTKNTNEPCTGDVHPTQFLAPYGFGCLWEAHIALAPECGASSPPQTCPPVNVGHVNLVKNAIIETYYNTNRPRDPVSCKRLFHDWSIDSITPGSALYLDRITPLFPGRVVIMNFGDCPRRDVLGPPPWDLTSRARLVRIKGTSDFLTFVVAQCGSCFSLCRWYVIAAIAWTIKWDAHAPNWRAQVARNGALTPNEWIFAGSVSAANYKTYQCEQLRHPRTGLLLDCTDKRTVELYIEGWRFTPCLDIGDPRRAPFEELRNDNEFQFRIGDPMDIIQFKIVGGPCDKACAIGSA